MSPTPRTAYLLAAIALSALLVPPPAAAAAALAVLVAAVLDARAVRTAPPIARRVPAVLSRGVGAPLEVRADAGPARRLRLRQPVPPDVSVAPAEADGALDSQVVGRRRGRHRLPPVADRAEGPLGLGAWHHEGEEPAELLVYPDLPAARRLALAVRQGRFREPGRLTRGPLGLGTDFESVREYLPDDDIRQVNWRATARLERPMSNQYRVEQDRELVCLVDAGRLMAAPLGDRTRLDAALDAVAAVGLVADELGDRCGAVAFDAEVRRLVRPRRAGGETVVRTLFDLEPAALDSDYELAFRAVGGSKRALVLVFTDLLDESAARSLVAAVPVLARRHAVVVAGVADPDLEALVRTRPGSAAEVYAAAAAVDVLDARARVSTQISRAGAQVIEAPPERLAAACIEAYLRAKARARL